jgi:transcriptional regulator with XRE-family HTH domain
MQKISEALRLLRVFHDLSQTDLAQRLGVSKSFMSEIESGKKEPTLTLLGRYSEELDIPLSSLLFFAESVGGSTTTGNHVVAAKVLKLLEWIGASRDNSRTPKRKPAQRETALSTATPRRRLRA